MNYQPFTFRTVKIEADLNTKISTITKNLHDCILSEDMFEYEEVPLKFLSMIVSCCTLSFPFREEAFRILENFPLCHDVLRNNKNLMMKIVKVQYPPPFAS